MQTPNDMADQAKMSENGLMLSLVVQFNNLGGFNKLLSLVKIGGRDPNFKCPITVSSYAIKTFQFLSQIGVKETICKDISKQISDIVEERLLPQNLLDEELKSLN